MKIYEFGVEHDKTFVMFQCAAGAGGARRNEKHGKAIWPTPAGRIRRPSRRNFREWPMRSWS